MKNFKELIIWQKGIEIVKKSYELSTQFPSAESIPANIAEGSSRNSDKDYSRFLQLSLGSAFELQTYLLIAREMKWAKAEEITMVETLLEEEIKMIHSFIKKLSANS